ncbi:hypothetical protein Tco_0313752 [Tanacetum coccineum]
MDFPRILAKEPYTTSYNPKGVVYLDSSKQKRLMWADELYKFSDKTLKSVRENLHYRLLNFKLGYNKDMPRIKWTNKDQNRTYIMVQFIYKQLLERRIMQSVEGLVGGRNVEIDYQLLQRTDTVSNYTCSSYTVKTSVTIRVLCIILVILPEHSEWCSLAFYGDEWKSFQCQHQTALRRSGNENKLLQLRNLVNEFL